MSLKFGAYIRLLPNGCAIKNWTVSGVFILLCFTIYWLYGGIIGPFLLLCFVATKILYRVEDSYIYYPDLPDHSRIYVPTPAILNLPYENVYTRAKDGTMLHMYLIMQPVEKSKNAPTILFLHGNAGNMGHRLENVAELYKRIKCNILMLEYRGYGFSHGYPSEEGLYMDAQAAIAYLTARVDINTNEIIVFGRSLGGAVAIDLASRLDKQKIWCLMLENTFTSIPDIAAILVFRMLKYLPLIFYKSRFLSLKKIRSITLPVIFISGLADTLVPPNMMLELYNNCKSTCKRLITIPDGTHNETWMLDSYYDDIMSFINELRTNPPARETSCHYLIDNI